MEINAPEATDTLVRKVGRIMYHKQANKTAIQSQHMIADALFSLLKRKSFQQVTVTEICEEAAIGRKTFYRNFELKEDVIDFRLDRLCEEFEKEIMGKSSDEQLYLFFSFSHNHMDYFLTMYKNGLSPLLEQKFSKFLPDTMPIWSENPIEQEYYSRFVIAGILAILEVWVKRGFQENIEKVVSLAQQILTSERSAKSINSI